MLRLEHTLKIANGWISPAGILYPCRYAAHADLSRRLMRENIVGLCADPQRELERKGWVKIKTNGGLFEANEFTSIIPFSEGRYEDWAMVTQKQMDTIFDYCQVHQIEIPKELRPKMDSDESLSLSSINFVI